MLFLLLAGTSSLRSVDLSANFEESVFSGDKSALVKFFAPWCGHCKALAPTWDKVAQSETTNVLVGEVDCTTEKGEEICKKYHIDGYPTVKYVWAGESEMEEYDGDMNYEGLLKITKQLNRPCRVTDLSACSAYERVELERYLAFTPDEREVELASLMEPIVEGQKELEALREEIAELEDEEEELDEKLKKMQDENGVKIRMLKTLSRRDVGGSPAEGKQEL